MGMKYNDRTGEFEEENRGHKPSTVRSHTTSASSQSSRSSSQGSKVSGGRSSCSSLLVLIVAFLHLSWVVIVHVLIQLVLQVLPPLRMFLLLIRM